MRVRYLCSRQQPSWPAVPAVDTWTSQPLPRPPASVAPVDLEPPAPDALLLVYEQNKSCLTLVLFQGPIKLVCPIKSAAVYSIKSDTCIHSTIGNWKWVDRLRIRIHFTEKFNSLHRKVTDPKQISFPKRVYYCDFISFANSSFMLSTSIYKTTGFSAFYSIYKIFDYTT